MSVKGNDEADLSPAAAKLAALVVQLRTERKAKSKSAPPVVKGEVSIRLEQVKEASLSEEQHVAFYWANVVLLKDGSPVEDLQGHVIPESELEQAASLFMRGTRTVGLRHKDFDGVGTVVHSIVTTRQWQEAVGLIQKGAPLALDVGWCVGLYIPKAELWEAVKRGDFPMLSIGGAANLEELLDGENS